MPRRNLPPDPGWNIPEPVPEPEAEPDPSRVYMSIVGPVQLSGHDDPVGIKQRRTKEAPERE